jgi:hypothetical protein
LKLKNGDKSLNNNKNKIELFNIWIKNFFKFLDSDDERKEKNQEYMGNILKDVEGEISLSFLK